MPLSRPSVAARLGLIYDLRGEGRYTRMQLTALVRAYVLKSKIVYLATHPGASLKECEEEV